MPLIFLAYLAVVAGLVAGRLAPAVAAALVGVGVVAAAWRRDAGALGLAACVAAGALTTAANVRDDAACRRAVLASREVDVTLDADARPGARVTGRATRCPMPVVVAVARGRAAAGAVVRVRGVVVPGARGVLVRAAAVTPLGETSALAEWRAAVGRTIDELFADDAPLVRALVVADASALPKELRDRYADAGLVHLLSVSGLHVSLVAAALELLLGAARLSRRRAAVASALAVALYVLMLGAPPPAVRAGTMLAAHVASRLLQRPSSPWAVLALGGLVPLAVDARAVFDVGYLLSVAGMASLVAGRALARRTRVAELSGWRRALGREVVIGVVASAVTAPAVAWCFGRVSLVAPLSNLAAAPIVSVLQPTLFLAVTLAPLRPLARHVAGAARLLARALDAVAAVSASVPHAALAVAPSLAVTVVCAGASAALLVACAARDPRRRSSAAIVGASCLAAAAWAPLLPPRADDAIELHALDVGQGDALLLRTPRGRWVLFDAGRVWRGGDAGRSVIVPYLRRHGGSLDAFLLSHPHADHVGGAATVMTALRPRAYWDAAFALGSESYRASLTAASAAGVAWHRVRPGDSLVVDGVALHVLAPDSAWTASLDDANLASAIVSVRWRGVGFLFVGDAELPEEQWLVDRAAADPRVADALRADVLKVGHHGSRTSTSPAFLALVRPRVALVSVGAGNTYGHPSRDVIERLEGAGAQVVRTDQWGTIVVRADGRTLTVDAGGERWNVPARAGLSNDSPRR